MWHRRDTPLCPQCEVENGTLIHTLWRWPKLTRYWAEVVAAVNRIWNLSLKIDPKLCLLGWLDEELYTSHFAITGVLFIARKLIAQKWLSNIPPLHKEWVAANNEVLLREELTYTHRGSPIKFERIWDTWLDIPGLAPLQLVQNRILGGSTSFCFAVIVNTEQGLLWLAI